MLNKEKVYLLYLYEVGNDEDVAGLEVFKTRESAESKGKLLEGMGNLTYVVSVEILQE